MQIIQNANIINLEGCFQKDLLFDQVTGGIIGVWVVPFESMQGMMHKILEDTYIQVWYIGDLDVKIKLCKIKI